ncbi:MAG: PD-(D/E)XK nuclease family transposase [Treponema sp.]|uniref:PD-(D/E)XK nuclease family transposase n=1 Tax=Treponema sp. TaxID=166 RepID=UPI0025E088D7|nr:PD-(D/E)XK nuclease family transposase [Treponema sp.]MBQ9282971.1 PD-(D/E)XK nuclease family transposase [Treponema sp.]
MKKQMTLRPSPTALLSPRCDSSFKAMFTAGTKESNEALKDFISTILSRPVESVELLPNEPVVEIIDEYQMSFDVSVKFNDCEKIAIEMQARNRGYDYSGRAEIQVARLLSTNNKKGDNWLTPPAFQISVLDFSFNKSDKFPLSWYTMKDKNGNELAGKLNVIFFDLVKIRKLTAKPIKNLTKLEKWGMFLSFAGDEQQKNYINDIISTEDGLMNAKSALLTVSQDEINWARQNSIFIGLEDYNAREQHFKDYEARLAGMARDITRKEQDVTRKEQDVTRKEQDITRKEQDVTRKEQDVTRKEQDVIRKQGELEQKESELKNEAFKLAQTMLKFGVPIEQIKQNLNFSPDELKQL